MQTDPFKWNGTRIMVANTYNAKAIGRWPSRTLLPNEAILNWTYALTAATRLFNFKAVAETARFKQERLELAARIVASDEMARQMLLENPTPINKAAVVGIWKKLHDEAQDALKRRGIRA